MGKNKYSRITIKEQYANGSILETELTIDGTPIKGIRSYTLTHDCKGAPILRLELLALDTSIDGNGYRIECNGDYYDASGKIHRVYEAD